MSPWHLIYLSIRLSTIGGVFLAKIQTSNEMNANFKLVAPSMDCSPHRAVESRHYVPSRSKTGDGPIPICGLCMSWAAGTV